LSLPKQKVQLVPIRTNLTISKDLAASFTFDVAQKTGDRGSWPTFRFIG